MKPITHLKPGQVFVFGSNLAGRHGAGAALIARRKFGAVPGMGSGPMGQSYAIATKDGNLQPLSLPEIGSRVAAFLCYANNKPNSEFLVTPVGCGLAGYSPAQIAPLFFAHDIPANVRLPPEFLALR